MATLAVSRMPLSYRSAPFSSVQQKTAVLSSCLELQHGHQECSSPAGLSLSHCRSRDKGLLCCKTGIEVKHGHTGSTQAKNATPLQV